MKEMLSILEGAFFFAIPPLLVLSVFGKRSVLRAHPRKVLLWFGLIILCYTLPLCFRRNVVSRYYMPLALFGALFAGVGASFFAQTLGRLLDRPRWGRGFLLLLTGAVCLSTALKLATAGRKPFIRTFAEQFSAQKDAKLLLLGIESPDCLKIAARINATSGSGRAVAENCESWQEVIEKYLTALPEDQEAYVLLRGRSSLPEIAMDVRTQYYSFPFEEIRSVDYRRSCFRLLRFTRRTGDGRIDFRRAKLLDHLPEPLRLTENGTFVTLDLAEYIPEKMRTADDFIIGRCGVFSRSEGLRWSIKETWKGDAEKFELLYFDSLYWPVARRVVRTSRFGAPAPVASASAGQNGPCAKVLHSDAAPLYPDVIQLYCGGPSMDYFWREFAPADGRLERLEASLPAETKGAALTGDKLTIQQGTPEVVLLLRDRLLQTEHKVTVRVEWTASSAKELSEKKWKVAVVGTGDFAEKIGASLAALLKQGRVDRFKLPEGIPNCEQNLARAGGLIVGFPVADSYDYLVFEPFLFNVFSRRIFLSDKSEFERYFAAILQQLRQKIPARKSILLIPPAPVGSTVPYASNARQARLDHFRLSWLLADSSKTHHPEASLVYLPGIVAPESATAGKGVQADRSAYSYLPSAYRKYAEYLGDCLMVLDEKRQ